jgi:predicted HTH domain antitoxin
MTLSTVVTKSIRLVPEENEVLKRISQGQGMSEAAMMRKLVLDGLAHYRLDEAVQAYSRGELDLSAAARHAGISVYHMLNELQRRDIASPAAGEKLVNGLETLAQTFGGSESLSRTLATVRLTRDDRP